jgi:hypothetical protein
VRNTTVINNKLENGGQCAAFISNVNSNIMNAINNSTDIQHNRYNVKYANKNNYNSDDNNNSINNKTGNNKILNINILLNDILKIKPASKDKQNIIDTMPVKEKKSVAFHFFMSPSPANVDTVKSFLLQEFLQFSNFSVAKLCLAIMDRIFNYPPGQTLDTLLLTSSVREEVVQFFPSDLSSQDSELLRCRIYSEHYLSRFGDLYTALTYNSKSDSKEAKTSAAATNNRYYEGARSCFFWILAQDQEFYYNHQTETFCRKESTEALSHDTRNIYLCKKKFTQADNFIFWSDDDFNFIKKGEQMLRGNNDEQYKSNELIVPFFLSSALTSNKVFVKINYTMLKFFLFLLEFTTYKYIVQQ